MIINKNAFKDLEAIVIKNNKIYFFWNIDKNGKKLYKDFEVERASINEVTEVILGDSISTNKKVLEYIYKHSL